jgi:metal-sulfur cluster biosynthetic enzyme
VEADLFAARQLGRDPELDESIVELGFVTEARRQGGRALVRLRLPTYFCAPNFAFLMVADARDAALSVPGVTSAEIVLEDHFAADQINAGVAEGSGFTGTFPEHAAGELDELRVTFRRKAHLAAMDRACRRLTRLGWTTDDLRRATLADLPAEERAQLTRRRADAGLSTDPDAVVLVDDAGRPVAGEQVALRLRMARTVGVSIEGNGHICRGLLAVRYPNTRQEATT